MEYFFETIKWIFFVVIFGAQISCIYSLSYYFGSKKKSVSDNARVFHHLVGTFCFISTFLALVSNYFGFSSFSSSDMNLELNVYFIFLMLVGLVLNLKSRGKI
jgi:hypothetical protein